MAERDKSEDVHEYFDNEPPHEETQKMKGSLFWPAIRIIAIIATAVYLIAVLVLPLASYVYSQLPFSANGADSCAFTSSYSCSNPRLLSNGNIDFSFVQGTGLTLYNVTLYTLPFSSNLTPAQTSFFPRSQKIATLLSGEVVNMTVSGGASEYRPVSGKSYSANVIITFATSVASIEEAQTIGYVTVS